MDSKLVLIATVFFVAILSAKSKLLDFEFAPDEPMKIRNRETEFVNLNITSNLSKFNFPLTLQLVPESSTNFAVQQSSRNLKSMEDFRNIRFKIRGKFLGHSKLILTLVESNSANMILDSDTYDVTVLRSKRGVILSGIFTGTVAVFVLLNTFLMGTQLDLDVIKEVVKKPTGPIIGFCCQFGLMPLISFAWSMLFLRDYPSLQIGYFATGCAPGGGSSNFWTILLDGNLDLSVTMTFFSNIAALVMMPFWLFTLGRIFYGGKISIPFINIVGSLGGLLLPSVVGILVRKKWPTFAVKVSKILKYFTYSIVLVTLTFGIYANFYIFKLMNWRTLVPGFLLPWTGYILAYLIAFALRQTHKNCRTIAIETGIQNGGIPIVLLKFSMPEPDSDMAFVMPVSVMMFTTLPLNFLLLGNIIRKKCCGKGEKQTADENSQNPIDVPVGDECSTKVYPAKIDANYLSVGYDNRAAQLNDLDLKF